MNTITNTTLDWEQETGDDIPEGHFRWHANQLTKRASRDIYVTLRGSLYQGPVGWGLELGSANPMRDVSLVEVLALMPSDGGTLLRTLIEAHLNLIDRVHDWIDQNALRSGQLTSREIANRASDLLRDLMRLRREAEYARSCGDMDLSRYIEARLSRE